MTIDIPKSFKRVTKPVANPYEDYRRTDTIDDAASASVIGFSPESDSRGLFFYPKESMGRRQPGTSVAVFVDGWNIHRACERAFNHGPLHPLLLGRVLAGERSLHSVDYYIGVPDPRVEAANAAARSRQLEFMRGTGVRTHPKKLRYRWEWRVDKWELPHPAAHKGETRSVDVTSFNQGREKGVDVALALDAYAASLREDVDVVIIVSADTDLNLVPEMIDHLPEGIGARVENAVVNPHKKPIINRSFAWTHQIDATVFAAVRDDNDYYTKVAGKIKRRQIETVIATKPAAND